MRRRPGRRRASPGLIRLRGCACPWCLGKAAMCMAGFTWLGKPAPDHAQQHAKADMLKYFDRLPAEIRNALNGSAVNLCSWCVEIWVRGYGIEAAVELVQNARFVGEGRALTAPTETVLQVLAEREDRR
jgi:hypothetical protein